MTITVLGIDPGYERCGFAVVQGERSPQLLTGGVITTSAGQPLPERIAEVAADITHLLELYQPDAMGVEGLYFARNTTTALHVAAVRGVLLYLGQRRGCLLYEPAPSEVKKSFTGNGQATKPEMMRMARLTYATDTITDDAADAVAVAHTVWYRLQNRVA
ncbi:crossover junction endodeoxyribonuclease RuvC [Candidatus Peribacteria bacterium]|nr:crossover junction endodeoxyribonuclease RuvC [Candidatus Peribacteria bacterium]